MQTFKEKIDGTFEIDCDGLVALKLKFNKDTNEMYVLGAMDGYGDSIINKVKEMEQ